MTAHKEPLFLRIFNGDQLLEVKQFTGEQVVIGREGNVDVLINDPSISPIHAMIEERNGKYHICDLGSQGGTYVNGEKIVDYPLESGTDFQIGVIRVEFHIGVPRGKKPATVTTVATPPPAAVPTPTPVPKAPAAHAAPPKSKHVVKEVPAHEVPKEVPKKPKVVPPVTKAEPVAEAIATADMLTVVTPRKHVPYVGNGTFAPPSKSKLTEIVRPGKGTVVEIMVAWGDRVIASKHFSKSGVITIGSNPTNDIVLPIFGSIRATHPLVKLEGGSATVLLSGDMTGEVVKEDSTIGFDELRRKGSIMPSGVGSAYTLQQNELVKISIGEGVSVIVRFVNNAPETLLMPFLDLSVNQLTGIILGLMATAVFIFYAYLYAPSAPDKVEEEEPPRKAQFLYKKTPAVAVEVSEQVAPKSAETVKTKEAPATAQGEEGASQEPKKTKNATSRVAQKKATTKSTANANPGAAPKVPPKDVTKSGLLGVFGTKGVQDQINKANAGAGNVAGLSKSATGSATDGEGAGVGGSALRDTGANGNGTATVGIAGVKTKGRGGGVSGYGTGTLGAKKNASLIAGDSEANFSPGIDKEAIRRVVQENLKQIKACYEKGLNRNPSLYGKIVIKWTIGPGGRVTAASIKNTSLDSPEVENCAVSRLRLWKFPEPPVGEEAEVSYPFIFQAQE